MPNNTLFFSPEQINLIPFYYVQDVYQKPAGIRLHKRHNQQKSDCSKGEQSWGSELHSEPLSIGFRGQGPLRKVFGSR